MRQVVVIHGGDTFETNEEYLEFLNNFEISLDSFRKKGWKSKLGEELGQNFDVVAPEMPCRWNAKYEEWKLWFEKIVKLLDENFILVGHSLGAIFLTKYLSENNISKQVKHLFLVAPPYDTDIGKGLASFSLGTDLSKLHNYNITFYHSEDDPIVPFENLSKYQTAIPEAEYKTFSDRGHFNQEEFPELIEDIKNLFQ